MSGCSVQKYVKFHRPWGDGQIQVNMYRKMLSKSQSYEEKVKSTYFWQI
jgi:hypothetical protein